MYKTITPLLILYSMLCPMACIAKPIEKFPQYIHAHCSGALEDPFAGCDSEPLKIGRQTEILAFNQCLDRLLAVGFLTRDITDLCYKEFKDLIKIINRAVSGYHDDATNMEYRLFEHGGMLRSEDPIGESMSHFETVTSTRFPFDFEGPLRPQFNTILEKHLKRSVYDQGVLTPKERTFLQEHHMYLPPTNKRVNFLLQKLYLTLQQFKTMWPAPHLAAYVHAEIIQIHPFENGNGRVARIMMNIILMQAGLKPIVFDSHDEYVAVAERCADAQNHTEFIKYLEETIKTRCAHPDCPKKGTLFCSACHTRRYCSKECQRSDWKNHKLACDKKS